MNREDILRMAREAGGFLGELPMGDAWLFLEEEYLERFAALVIANHPPQSYMTWQEGYEAGKQSERARLQAFMRQMFDSYSLASDHPPKEST